MFLIASPRWMRFFARNVPCTKSRGFRNLRFHYPSFMLISDPFQNTIVMQHYHVQLTSNSDDTALCSLTLWGRLAWSSYLSSRMPPSLKLLVFGTLQRSELGTSVLSSRNGALIVHPRSAWCFAHEFKCSQRRKVVEDLRGARLLLNLPVVMKFVLLRRIGNACSPLNFSVVYWKIHWHFRDLITSMSQCNVCLKGWSGKRSALIFLTKSNSTHWCVSVLRVLSYKSSKICSQGIGASWGNVTCS